MFKSIAKKVFSNTIYQVIGKVVSGGSALFVTALITRNLGIELYGEYSIIFTYVFLFFVIADFGVNAIIIKEFAVDKELAKNRFVSVLTLRIAIGLSLIFIASIGLVFAPYTYHVKQAILLTLPIILLQSVSSAASIIYQSYLRYKQQMIATIVGSSVTIFFVWFLISTGRANIFDLAFVSVISAAFVVIVSLFFIREYINWGNKKIDPKYWGFVIKDAIPLGISLFFNTMMIHVDRLILSFVSSSASVGIYSLAYKIFDVFLVIVTFFMNAMYPILLKTKSESREKYIKLIKYSVAFMSFIALMITIVSTSTSGFFIPRIWGAEMFSSTIPFNILISGSVLFYITSPLSWVLVIEGHQKYLPKVYGFGLLLNAILNIIFISKYDYTAAAWTTLITEFVVLIFLAIKIKLVLKETK